MWILYNNNYVYVYINFRAEKENDSALLVPLPDVGKNKCSDRSMEVILSAKDLSILQYDVIVLSPDFLRKLRGFSKSIAYVGSVAKGNIG